MAKTDEDYSGTDLSATKPSRTRNCVFEYKMDSAQILFLCISPAHPSFIILAAITVNCVISSWAVSAFASGNGYSSHTRVTDHVTAVALLTIYIS